jgi:hypothetical protein
MAKYVIVPIVEGHGEVAAVSILIQRWLRFRRFRNVAVHVDGPVRAAGQRAIKVPHDGENGLGVEHYVEIALLRRPDAILVLLDADTECPKTLGPSLLVRARALVPADYPIGVVIAKSEYEAWFLAAFPSARFRQGLRDRGFTLSQRSLPTHLDVEAVANCKGYIAKLVSLKKYEETVLQKALTDILPFTKGMPLRSRSFRKLLKELDWLLTMARRRRS